MDDSCVSKDYVKLIASDDITKRRNALMNILREEEIPFELRRIKENEHWVENIVVSLHPSNRRMVIGAHYDNVQGSTGANDNTSSVSILIRLAKYLLINGKKNIEIVFFDREEYYDHGSSAYIRHTGKENIKIMVNLDMCGFGDTIAIVTKGNIGNQSLYKLLTPKLINKYHVQTLDRLPFRFGDDDTFDEFQIPNIAITMMPYEEIIFLKGYLDKLVKGGTATQEEKETYANLTYSKTMHNAPMDNVNSVSAYTMDLLYMYLIDGLCNAQ